MTLETILKHLSYPQILDNIICGIFIVDTEGQILLWNKGMAELTGYGPEEAIGKHCSFLETDKCASFDCREGRMNCGLFQMGELRHIQCRLHRKNGKIVDILRNVRCIYDDVGQPIAGIESVMDVTELLCTQQELKVLKQEIKKRSNFGRLVGKSPAIGEVYNLIEEVADTTATVLITGESGTGKELVAEAIHFNSPRKDGPLIRVNCSALTETLLESELFGHVKGAFTGAISDKAGRFELADNGTLFLDEIGDLNLSVQVKLLRVLQERTFERVGGTHSIKVDVRIIAATNRNLAERVKQGLFREDLYYRLNVFPIRLPSLSERPEDIPLLVRYFIDKLRQETDKPIDDIDGDALALLMDYSWPGNVRELENAMAHAFIRAKERILTPFHFPQTIQMISLRVPLPASTAASPLVQTVDAPTSIQAVRQDITREMLEMGLKETRYNRSKLAALLNISRTTLWKKLKEFGLG